MRLSWDAACGQNVLLEYNGQKRPIEKILRSKSGAIYGYELEDVCSKYGVPYTFSADMIR